MDTSSDEDEMDVCPFQPVLVMMDSLDDQQVAARKVNIHCKFNLGPACSEINLQMLAQMFPDLGGKCVVERMPAVFFRLSRNMPCLRNKIQELGLERIKELGREQTQSIYQRALVLLYAPGNAVITGMGDEAVSRCLAHQFCLMLSERTGIPAVLSDFVMTNIVVNCQMQYGVNLNLLDSNSALASRIRYNPLKFPMAVIHSKSKFDGTLAQHDCKTAALVSARGCINITGVTSMRAAVAFLREIFPELWRFQIAGTDQNELLHMDTPVLQLRPSASLARLKAAAVGGQASLLGSGGGGTGGGLLGPPPSSVPPSLPRLTSPTDPDSTTSESQASSLLDWLGLDESVLPDSTSMSLCFNMLIDDIWALPGTVGGGGGGGGGGLNTLDSNSRSAMTAAGSGEAKTGTVHGAKPHS